MKIVVQCPLCSWRYEVERIRAPIGSVFATTEAAIKSRYREADDALAAHFQTHTTVEWVRGLTKAQAEVERLQAELRERDMVIAHWSQRFAVDGHTARFVSEISEIGREKLAYLIATEVAKRLVPDAGD